ncbi:MAG: hypothetical protein LJE62_03865 [Silicimonas sp.]|jgi:hypothetical protein|nr:hypothetical protein [Silicimonas sp.]
MFALLKIVHFLALAIGLGGGIANAIVGAKITSRDPAMGAPVQKLIGRLSFGALILLWVTGLWMLFGYYGFSDLSLWFWVKILAALGLTAAGVTAQLAMLKPGPETPAKMKKLGMIMTGAATLAVILAVLAFT